MLRVANELDPPDPGEWPEDEDEEPVELDAGAAQAGRKATDLDPRIRWIYTPDMSSRTGWEAYLIRPPEAERRPVGFRPVRVRRNEDPGRSR